MNLHDARTADALNNQAQYIAQLIEMPDSILTKKLGIIRQQMEMAYEKNLTAALETLSVWERQIIEARLIKGDFDDAPPKKHAKKKALKEKEMPLTAEPPKEDTSSHPAPDAVSPKPAQMVLFR